MKIQTGGSLAAFVLAGFALVVAASGTAYAVTTSKVIIGDPVHADFRARIDAQGKLQVGGTVAVAGRVAVVQPNATIDITSTIGFDAVYPISSVTSATLGLNSLHYSNPRLNSSYTGTDYLVSLVQIQTGTAGNCDTGSPGVAVVRILDNRWLSPGDDTDTTYPAPVLVRPISGKAYCLGLSFSHVGGAQNTLYTSQAQVTGYVLSGTYTGTGLATAARTAAGRAAPAVPRLLTR